jgi:hypothetical protein
MRLRVEYSKSSSSKTHKTVDVTVWRENAEEDSSAYVAASLYLEKCVWPAEAGNSGANRFSLFFDSLEDALNHLKRLGGERYDKLAETVVERLV